MKARFALASLAALAWAEAASAQEMTHAVNGAGTGRAAPLIAAPPAPVPTDIRADTGRLGLGTQVTHGGNVHTIDGGTRTGNNLFHSFSRFDLGQGDFARWVHSAGDPATIRNVINRVTGGDPSHIFGAIDSFALPNADFYFINPAGIVFGEGARIDVPAGAHFSTASELRFANGAAFTVATPGGSTFSVANPAAFGFVGGEGDIAAVNTGSLFSGVANISLSAANISLRRVEIDAAGVLLAAVGGEGAAIPLSGPLPTALAGRIELIGDHLPANLTEFDTRIAALGPDGLRVGAGTFLAERAALIVEPEGGDSFGLLIATRDDLTLRDANVAVSDFTAQAGPLVLLSGGQLTIGSGSVVSSDANTDLRGVSRSAGMLIQAPNILIGGEDGSGRVTLVGTASLGGQPAGDVTIRGGSLTMRNAFLSGFSSSADAGTVLIDLAGNFLMDRAQIDTRTLGVEFATSGNVAIRARTIALINDSRITNTSFGNANPGFIALTADEIDLDNSEIRSDVGGLGCEPCGNANDAGAILLSAGRLGLVSSSITADTRSAGLGGSINILADVIDVTRSAISSNAFREGSAGDVTISGSALTLDDGRIESRTEGPGGGGFIDIKVGELTATGASRIVSNAGERCDSPPCSAETGNAGDISIAAQRLTLIGDDESGAPLISSDTHGTGAAGTISLIVPEILLDSAAISSSTTGSGAGGTIMVAADTVTMRSARLASNTEGPGRGGSIILDVQRSLSLAEDSRIASNSFLPESGDGGTITIAAPEIRLASASKILTETSGGGDAGSIGIGGDDLTLSGASTISSSTQGAGTGGSLVIDVDRITISGSFIGADSGRGSDDGPSGNAGSITINAAERLTLRAEELDGETIQSIVSSDTVTEADAGGLTLDVGSLVIDNSVLSSETRGDGDAGTVFLTADRIEMRNGAVISTTTRPVESCLGCDETPSGNGGLISIEVAGTMALESGSQVLSSTATAGNAGTILLVAGTLRLQGGRISTSAEGVAEGTAGLIGINARQVEIIGAGSIETISRNANEAGGILVEAGTLLLSGPLSRISSSSEFAGRGDAGGIFVSAGAISLLEGAQLTSSSRGGAAGSIEIFMPETALLRLESAGTPSQINTSSGPGLGGRIFISRPLAIISNGGSILALGQQGGANVEINSPYLINSSDRANRVAVSGTLLLESPAYDVSAGTVDRDLSVIDASGVLRGQCAAVRSTGQVSQLVVRPIGPYGSRPISLGPSPGDRLAAAELQGACS